jgi:DNA-binding LacI/PurR family transcriptional regulator
LRNRFTEWDKPIHIGVRIPANAQKGEAVVSIIDEMGRPTITDVARKSGVSKTTVSVILNKSPASQRVSPETQQRVRQIAEQLGYRPNWRARALSNQKTHTIGVLYTPPMPIVVRGNYEGIMIGINEVLTQHGYHLLFVPLSKNPDDWGSVLLDQRMDGCLVLSRVRDPLLPLLKKGRLPVTLVNAFPNYNLPCVMADDYEGAKESTRHLLGLGHRDIVFFLGHQPQHYSIAQRQQGYAEVMCEAGLGANVRVFGGPVEEFVPWLKQQSPRPTAIMVFTHFLAVKLLQVLWDAGLRVPDDVSVTTYSNAYPVEDVIPPLTAIALPTVEMGRTAAELLMEQIQTGGTAEPKCIALKESLVVRRSTAAPRAEQK